MFATVFTLIVTALFWLSALFVVYTYLGYPALLTLLARTRREPPAVTPASWPSVAVIVPVHNERHHLAAKLANLREIDYPAEQLQLVFVSDGSSDGSNEFLAEQTAIDFIEYSPRAGKPTALNRAVAGQTAQVLVMTDARQAIDPGSIKRLVRQLLADGVGAVSGNLVLGASGTTASQVGLYWRYEKYIRQYESQYHSVAGVTGALYAIRRGDYHELPADTLLDDFEVPIRILKNGQRILFDKGALVFDQAQADPKTEMTRKIRTLTGNYQSFARNQWLFTGQNPILWQFLSHKVFRLLVPYALLICLLSNVFVWGPLYLLTLFVQLSFYGAGLFALMNPAFNNNRLASFAAVFISMNWAAVKGYLVYRQQIFAVQWDKTS